MENKCRIEVYTILYSFIKYIIRRCSILCYSFFTSCAGLQLGYCVGWHILLPVKYVKRMLQYLVYQGGTLVKRSLSKLTTHAAYVKCTTALASNSYISQVPKKNIEGTQRMVSIKER